MPDRAIRLAPAAADDLRDVKLYTIEKWGYPQWVEYLDRLDGLMRQLGIHPALGAARDDVRPGLRSLPIGSHVIWYRVAENRIEVVRLLHTAMDSQVQL